MLHDKVTQGERYDLEISGTDEDGVVVALDNTWEVKCDFTKGKQNGEIVASPVVIFQAGKALGEVSTEAWCPGVYFYQVALAEANGIWSFSDVVRLKVLPRNTRIV